MVIRNATGDGMSEQRKAEIKAILLFQLLIVFGTAFVLALKAFV